MVKYTPKSWNLKPDLIESENSIFEHTIKTHEMKIRICTGLVALLYEQLLFFEGEKLDEIYPLTNDTRAKRWLILVYASSAFLYSSAIMDLATRGRYLESEALMRSLLETVAFAEYFYLNENECYPFFKSAKGIPKKRKVFKFLQENGRFPQGGPENVIVKFHASAHANINSRMKHWFLKDKNNKIIGFHVHKFDSESLIQILQNMIMPLLGIQQFLYNSFKNRMSESIDLKAKWQIARNMKQIQNEFPNLWFIIERL